MSWLEGVNSTLNLHSNTSSSLVCTNLYDHRPVARVLMSLHYSLVFMLGFLGNALALHVIRPNLAKINSTTLYSANLAASDVLFTLALPLRIAYYALGFHWPLGETLCRVTALLFYVNTYAGVNFMTCLAVDRFVAVVLPLRYTRFCRARTVRYVCVGVWVLVLVQTLPLLSVTMTRAEPDGTTTCMEYPNFENGVVEGLPYVLIGAVVMGYGIPVATILCCYLVLLWKLRLVTRSGVGGRGHRSLRSQKATGVIAGMSLHFTVCLMNLNCCLDPFVYFFACKGYKRRVMKMLRVQVSASFSSVVRTGEDAPFKRGGTRDGRSRLGSRTACPVALDDVTNTIPGPETETGEPETETGAGD
ncbi:G-protein coupled receptor 183-like isoform X4 [Salmo salar]|uniref:G-protein coupled receptor 183-like isoform X4 n=1 Tax=Salmo salar TaxID=8030 RepID=A0ABM3D9L4_SALSA|nr:G-protein coupled receptor 183-like isoform X4 [Salmo salar]